MSSERREAAASGMRVLGTHQQRVTERGEAASLQGSSLFPLAAASAGWEEECSFACTISSREKRAWGRKAFFWPFFLLGARFFSGNNVCQSLDEGRHAGTLARLTSHSVTHPNFPDILQPQCLYKHIGLATPETLQWRQEEGEPYLFSNHNLEHPLYTASRYKWDCNPPKGQTTAWIRSSKLPPPRNLHAFGKVTTSSEEPFTTLDPIPVPFWTPFSKAHNHVIIVFFWNESFLVLKLLGSRLPKIYAVYEIDQIYNKWC